MKKSNAITFALLAHALLIESVNTLLMVFARSRDEGKCIPGDYTKKEREKNETHSKHVY